MDGGTLYETDILAWSERQAAALRALAGRRDLPNALDLENVIEEIEALGRSELKAATGPIRLMLVHLLKLAADPESPARAHWIGEILNWHADLLGSFSPSMRQRIDIDLLWRRAVHQAGPALAAAGRGLPPDLPETCPFALDAFLAETFDVTGAVDRLKGPAAPPR
jgi:hypothetical protein